MNTRSYETPPRIAVAMEYLQFCLGIEKSCGAECTSRELRPDELAVYSAALEALRLYFVGEMDFIPPAVEKADADEPDEPVSTPVCGAD